jgi:hypothetical protein
VANALAIPAHPSENLSGGLSVLSLELESFEMGSAAPAGNSPKASRGKVPFWLRLGVIEAKLVPMK